MTVSQLRLTASALGTTAWELLREAEERADQIVSAGTNFQLVEERPKAGSNAAAGWFIGGAAVGALIASLMRSDDKTSSQK